MPIEQITPEQASRYRAQVRDRLSQRNRLAAAVTLAAAPIPIAVACAGYDAKDWTAVLLSGAVAMLFWHVRSGFRPKVVCPRCGDNWEYDEFLRSGACEDCGLSLTPDPRPSPSGSRHSCGDDRSP